MKAPKPDTYTEVNRKFEALFQPRIQRALQAKVNTLIARLRDGGYSEGVRYLNEDLGNPKLAEAVKLLYVTVGGRHARMNYSRLMRDRVQKGFGFNEVWTAYIEQYFERFLLEKITFEVNQNMRDQLLRVLQKGINEGTSMHDMVEQLSDWKIARYRSARIVRTEVNRAANVGAKAQEQTSEYQQTKTWRSLQDFRVRGHKRQDHASHVLLDTVTIDADDKFIDARNGDMLDLPGDVNASAASTVNCFPGDTLVEAEIIGAQRLEYSGKIIEIVTRSGKRLSVTPNHAIFTNKGTVAAKDICKGDYVFSNIKEANNISLAATSDDVNQKPSFAAEVFGSLVDAFGSQKRMSVGLDFDGDSRFGNGYIDIVDMGRELEMSVEFTGQNIEKGLLQRPHFERISIGPLRSHDALINAYLPAERGSMGRRVLGAPFFNGHFGPFGEFCLGSSTNWNVSRFEFPYECGTTDASFLSQLLQGNPGNIIRDEIIEIRERDFCGHVYDFSTLSGAILANSIYISNCRCRVVYKYKRDENGDLIPKRRTTTVIRPQDNRRPVIIPTRRTPSRVSVQMPGANPNRQIITI